jgi:hypothetical protein
MTALCVIMQAATSTKMELGRKTLGRNKRLDRKAGICMLLFD